MIASRTLSMAVVALLVGATAALSSCKETTDPGASPPQQNQPPTHQADDSQKTPDPQALVSRGRAVYQSVCIACHNPNPKKAGTLGPEVWGSSLELLQARVVNGTYPEGYKPKRTTHVMQPLPQVQKDLPAIQAYLSSQP